MFKREKMLETIYESDENLVVEIDETDDDSSKSTEQPSRLSYYICLCMIIGCFLAFGLLVAISLNPYLLTQKSETKTLVQLTKSISFTQVLIEQLERFSQQINEQLDLPFDTIKILPLKISNNQNDSLWLLSYLNYPRQCQPTIQCRQNLLSKLKASFTKLSIFLSTNQFHPEIQLNWCQLINNSTRAILVSLVSNSNVVNQVDCGNLNPNLLISQIAARDTEINPSIVNLSCRKSSRSIHCQNNLATQVLFMENSY